MDTPTSHTTQASSAPGASADSGAPDRAARTPRRRQIAEVARALLDAEGREALTMRRVAEVLGIRASSLYKHVPDKAALEVLVASRGFEEFAEVMEAAAEGIDDPAARLTALGEAYRLHAIAYPDLYRLMNHAPLGRAFPPEGVEDRAARPFLEAVGGDEHLARAAWAFAHGMAGLEIDGRLQREADVDTTWAVGMASLMITAHEHTVQQ